ncbi:MAG: peroxidase, partial [Actinomycetota bacterium]|nr:peroxidase [Actinomycetota bacterium]
MPADGNSAEPPPEAATSLPYEAFDHHGGSLPRGLRRVPRAAGDGGRFGRMFPDLPPFSATDEALKRLADSMGPGGPPVERVSAGGRQLEPGENPDLASGYTYVGQFADHDITFDPDTSLQRQSDPNAVKSFRTPRFDLDSLYGTGPLDSPFLYDQEDPAKLLVGQNTGPNFEPEDLPRNRQGRAVICDPRNDLHVIISQLHLAFIHFHNAVVDH